MRALRHVLCVLLFAIPVWTAAPAAVVPQTLTADVNADGVRDSIETGRARAELVVHLSSLGAGQRPGPRDSLACDGFGHRRLTPPGGPPPDDDLCGDSVSLLVLTSIGLQGRAMVSEPLHVADESLARRARHDRTSPRGPPSSLPLS
jgi:hypothetical protein